MGTADIPFCRPDDQPCGEAQEFDLVRNMLIAAVEERYKDAGELLLICIKETVMQCGCI
jgi:hypothetical protein